MKCPNCNENLVMSDRQGVEIDYCPECRGVWLDRGELDKIIERSADYASYPKREDFSPKKHDRRDTGHPSKKRKKESFLGELFDF